jgi:hypothetical protein
MDPFGRRAQGRMKVPPGTDKIQVISLADEGKALSLEFLLNFNWII